MTFILLVQVWVLYIQGQHLLSAAVADGRGGLIDGQDVDLSEVDVRRARRGPDDLFGDVFRNHCTV